MGVLIVGNRGESNATRRIPPRGMPDDNCLDFSKPRGCVGWISRLKALIRFGDLSKLRIAKWKFIMDRCNCVVEIQKKFSFNESFNCL
jgi:hypothetical protein